MSEFLDIYLSAHCEFYVTTSAGLDAVGHIFRKPLLYVSFAPFQKQLQYWYSSCLFVLKKILDRKSNKFIPYLEVDREILKTHDIKKVLEFND